MKEFLIIKMFTMFQEKNIPLVIFIDLDENEIRLACEW